MAETLALNYVLAKKGLGRIKALAHPLRLSIIAFIDKNGEINVNKIYRSLRLEQSITSQHLKILREARLVDMEKSAQQRIYTINTASLHEIEEWIGKINKMWSEKFDRLEKALEDLKKKGGK